MDKVQGGGETEAISKEDIKKSNSPPPSYWIIYNEHRSLLFINVSKQHIFCNNILKLHVVF